MSRFVDIDPLEVRFTHSKVRPFYSGCGRRIEDTITSILDGRTNVDDLPKITVLTGADGHMFSLNNRRLYTFKQLRQLGALEHRVPPNTVNVRVKPALPRELKKYTVESCSLNCTIMHESAAASETPAPNNDLEGGAVGSNQFASACAVGVPEPAAAEGTTIPRKVSAKMNKKCVSVQSIAVKLTSFKDVLDATPQSTHVELKKAMKLAQQGKGKQCGTILNKLESGNMIGSSLRDCIQEFFESA